MKIKNKKLIDRLAGLAIIFLNYWFFLPVCRAGARADLQNQMDAVGAKGWGAVITNPNSLAVIIQYVISAFLGLLGIIFIVLIIYAGFNWMTAQGEEEKVTTAKNTLARAIIGLIIIVAAYSITYFVFSNLPSGGGGGGVVGGSP